jgi:glycosyltransferase involved in cell wall biosynthesis
MDKEHSIKIIVTFRNVGDYIIDCINSVQNQIYNNYEIFLFDDCSTDENEHLLTNIDDPRIHVFRNSTRKGPLENLYYALLNINAKSDDVIILLDGDDYLFGEYVFQILNFYYNNDILITYGQYITSFGLLGHCSQYTEEEFLDIRKAPWKASHLKSFKYKVFEAFLKQDPYISSFKDNDNNILMATSDMAIMIPLLQIAGYLNSQFIHNILYCYRLHPRNDHSSEKGRQLQLEAEAEIRNKPKFNQVF